MSVGPDLSQLTVSQLHELTGRERRWLRKRLADRNVQASRIDGRARYFPSRQALEAVYRDGQAFDGPTEQARLTQARRELAELSLQERRGDLLPRGDVVRVWSTEIAGARRALRAIPGKAMIEIPGFTREMARELLPMIDGVLNDLADRGASAVARRPPT